MIRNLWNKYKEYVLYLLFGGLTTVVNYIVYVPLTVWLKVPALVANIIAWIAAVAFAYVTNRIWVFESKTKGLKGIIKEIAEFTLGRVVSLGIEEAILAIFINWLGSRHNWFGFNENTYQLVIKLIASVVTIILNYIFGKFIIFRKKPDTEETEKTGEM